MGMYRKKVYCKNINGFWECCMSGVEKIPHTQKYWESSQKAERKSRLGERTYLSYQTEGEGKEKYVSVAITYFGNNEKVVRTLITLNNKLPKGYKVV